MKGLTSSRLITSILAPYFLWVRHDDHSTYWNSFKGTQGYGMRGGVIYLFYGKERSRIYYSPLLHTLYLTTRYGSRDSLDGFRCRREPCHRPTFPTLDDRRDVNSRFRRRRGDPCVGQGTGSTAPVRLHTKRD